MLVPRVFALLVALTVVQICGRHPMMLEVINLVFTHAAMLFGPGHARMVGPQFLYVAGYTYRIVFWCTPTTLACIGLVLLWLRSRSVLHFALLTPTALIAAMLALACNFIASVWLREFGLSWQQAHKPGLYLIYICATTATGLAIGDRVSKHLSNRRNQDTTSTVERSPCRSVAA